MLCLSLTSLNAQSTEKPNIVLILVDDMPWFGTPVEMDKSVPGSKIAFRTMPNVEKIAASSMIFSSAHAAAGICAPARCAIQTGMSSPHNGLTGNGKTHVEEGAEVEYRLKGKDKVRPVMEPVSQMDIHDPSIGVELKKLGYATAHFGKWHLYGGGPAKNGYDESDGETDNDSGKSDDPQDPKLMFSTTKKSISFINKNAAEKKPFYLQISHYAEHNQPQCLESTYQKALKNPAFEKLSKGEASKAATNAAMIEDLDSTIGMVLEALKKSGVSDNTYLVFTSDNGHTRFTGEADTLRGDKWWLWECGIRIPLMVMGPKIKPGSTCHLNVIGYDFLPTFIELAGGKSSDLKNIDGVSLKPILFGEEMAPTFKERPLYFNYPQLRTSTPHAAIIAGDYKLLYFYERPEGRYLYNLKNDLGEKVNLAKTEPEKAAVMYKSMMTYFKEVNASLPKANPEADPNYKAYDPDNAAAGSEREESEGEGKKGKKKK